VDGELDGLRCAAEAALQADVLATRRLRAEGGFMMRKVNGLAGEVRARREAVAALADRERELGEAVAAKTRDAAGYRKEIGEREGTLAAKRARLFELKKKNKASPPPRRAAASRAARMAATPHLPRPAAPPPRRSWKSSSSCSTTRSRS